jgi:hypothetical protein
VYQEVIECNSLLNAKRGLEDRGVKEIIIVEYKQKRGQLLNDSAKRCNGVNVLEYRG